MYQDLVNNFRMRPRDVHTVPVDKSDPFRWFYAYADQNAVYVESGREHAPKSQISGRRRLNPTEYETMLDIYQRRKRGEKVSKEATATTTNQVYWYGIFADLGL